MRIIDMHCDTIMALMNTENNIYESENMIDIKKLKQGDYLLPNLALENENYEQIGKCGLLRLKYIKENKKGLYTTLLMRNELTKHLLSVSNECEERLKTLMNNYIKFLINIIN